MVIIFGNSVTSRIHTVPAQGGAEILITHNGRDPTMFDLYRLNLDTGETTPTDLVSEQSVNWSVNKVGEVYGPKT